jgi:hypothetical protein
VRDKLAAFDQALQDVPTLVGAGNVLSPATPWKPSGLMVFAQSADAPGSSTTAWPLATPLDQFGQEIRSDSGGGLNSAGALRCGIVTGDDLEMLLTALNAAAPDTVWTSAESTWALTIRPQLPDESACPGT